MKHFLIVGQGIAGTVLGWTMHQLGADVRIMDAGFGDSASNVAAGVINPVTGKRYVKTWMLDELLPFARAFYTDIGKKLGTEVWHERSILRLLNSTAEENDWAARCALPEYLPYVGERPDAGAWASCLHPGFRFGTLKSAAQVDFSLLIQSFRRWAIAEGLYIGGVFDFEKTGFYKEKYDGIVFCEGYRGKDNPYFSYLPWQLSKGEALIFKFEKDPDPTLCEMLKKTMQIVPLRGNTFWAGATYQWDFKDSSPSGANKELIVKELDQVLGAKYEILDHKAAIRPTVKDRRPFLGCHPEHPELAIFNGLGTKGALLAPYWAKHLAEHLISGMPLDKAVDVGRV